MNEAKALAEIYRILYRKQRFNLHHQGRTLPLHHWLLRIAFEFWNLDFDGWGNFDGSKPQDTFAKVHCFGEPTLNEIFSHWRDVDLEPLRDQLIWLCDYYTHRTRYASKEFREFASDLLHTRFPATILAWFRLRECLGLDIPTIDHPLMKPDYAQLFPARPFYTDDLIEGVLARLRREEIPDLDVHVSGRWRFLGDGHGDRRFSSDFGDTSAWVLLPKRIGGFGQCRLAARFFRWLALLKRASSPSIGIR